MMQTQREAEKKSEQRTAVTIADTLVRTAIERGASDIHLEPTDGALRVRMRIDGVLYDQPPVEREVATQLISRLKVLARIDIAEKRVPQDGKFNLVHNGQSIDLRASTFPSIFGQKLVIRVLDRAAHAMALDQLGLEPEMLTQLTTLLAQPHGFFLATGPTGSGKTTTLYAALSLLHTPEKNTVTLEDPVEYGLDGITQGQINPAAGFTFEKGIRAVLRQDPDILMVGEIRDRQTATVAIEAALTGHLVLSTLHTNDALSVVVRLMDMGIEPFLINASLSGVLAQRLARKICQSCCTPYKPDSGQRAVMQKFGLSDGPLYRGTGCNACDQLGYKGRTGIFELLILNDDLRRLIVKEPSPEALQKQASAEGMYSLIHDGARKVAYGLISLDELARTVI